MARPREFDPDEALEKAMLQFWANGYHDTSIRDLTARTGVNQYGLYGTFRNKRGLYLSALDLYRNTVTREVIETLRGPGPLGASVRQALEALIGRMRTVDGPVGCMIANAAIEVAPEDEDAAKKVRAHMALLKKTFRSRLERAVSDGELSEERDLDALGEFLATTAYSLGFLLRAGCDDDHLQRHLGMALSVLD